MDGFYNGTPLKWMIWGGFPLFWKHQCIKIHAVFLRTDVGDLGICISAARHVGIHGIAGGLGDTSTHAEGAKFGSMATLLSGSSQESYRGHEITRKTLGIKQYQCMVILMDFPYNSA